MQDLPPRISLVVPAYRNRAGLARLLQTIVDQCWPVDKLEVVVVDDQSGDDLSDVVGPYHDRVNIKWLVSAVKGRPGARNTGAAASSGDHLVFIDDDTVLEPGYLQAMAMASAACPDAAIVGRIRPEPGCPALWNELLDVRFSLHQKHTSCNPEDLPFSCLFTGSLMLPRALFDKLGGFDEKTFSYYGGEDFDLGVRLRQANARIVYTAAAVSYHSQSRTSLKQYLEKLRWSARSMIVFLNKHKDLVNSESVLKGFPCGLPGVYAQPIRGIRTKIKMALMVFGLAEIALLIADAMWFCGLRKIARRIAVVFTKVYYEKHLGAAIKTLWLAPKKTSSEDIK